MYKYNKDIMKGMIIMEVPEHILKVARPAQTVVIDTKKDTPLRYVVKKDNADFKKGRVIGYIIEDSFVPIEPNSEEDQPFALSYGVVALAYSLSEDIIEDLLRVHAPNDALRVLTIAILQIIHPTMSIDQVASMYRKSYLSVYFPGLALSSSTVKKLYKRLGEDLNARNQFFALRKMRIKDDHHIVVDQVIKNDQNVSDLNHFTLRIDKSENKSLSILYASDLETMEPICDRIVLGPISSSLLKDFIKTHGINNGLIVDEQIHDDLHTIVPLGRYNPRVEDTLLDYDGVLKQIKENVLYKKIKNTRKGIEYVYTFKDLEKENAETPEFIAGLKKGENDIDKINTQMIRLGTSSFLSNEDLDPLIVYRLSKNRDLYKMTFQAYKNEMKLKDRDGLWNFSLYGKEFINFISTLITVRMIKKEREAGLLDHMTYGDLLDMLNNIWRMSDAPRQAARNDGYWQNVFKDDFKLLEKLGLIK